jgi:hypothetical protein
MSKSSQSLESDPYLEVLSSGAGEPRSRKVQPDSVYTFLSKFAVALAIFVLAVLIAYLAR